MTRSVGFSTSRLAYRLSIGVKAGHFLAFVSLLPGPAQAAVETGSEVAATVCPLIDRAAKTHAIPNEFLTRLIWQESSFRTTAVSPAGAQGVAQFMPGTAAERNLANPFDPEEAIPKAAELLAELRGRFGNLGLAAAAYNAGSGRVAAWLAGRGGLPRETQDYVLRITRRSADDWKSAGATGEAGSGTAASCVQLAALIRRTEPRLFAGSALVATWGVQLAGGFSKAAALASFERTRHSFAPILGQVQPLVLAGRLRNRGFSTFYRVRAPAPSRAGANALCSRIRQAVGACAVLRG